MSYIPAYKCGGVIPDNEASLRIKQGLMPQTISSLCYIGTNRKCPFCPLCSTWNRVICPHNNKYVIKSNF